MPILIPNETSALDAASPALKTSAHKANFFICSDNALRRRRSRRDDGFLIHQRPEAAVDEAVASLAHAPSDNYKFVICK